MEEIWPQWLESDDGLAFLRACARRICGMTRLQGLIRGVLDIDVNPADTDAEMSLRSELFMFVVERPGVQGHLRENMIQDNPRKAVAHLVRAFIQHLQNQNNRRDSWRRYYQAARRILQRHSGQRADLIYHPTHYGTFFAFCGPVQTPLPIAPQDYLETADFATWPAPFISADLPPDEALLEWARFFYHEARCCIEYDCLVPLRAFVYYVLAKGGLGWQLNQVGRSDEIEKIEDSEQQPSLILPTPDQIAALAASIFESWNKKQQRAFCLRFHQELTLSEMAAELNYAGSSGVQPFLKGITNSLHEALSTWEGLSPPDIDPDCWDEFKRVLLKFCQNQP